jgi:hypothetical protein
MATYTAITDAEIDQDSPITQTLMTKYRDNLTAVIEDDSTAPKIKQHLRMSKVTGGGNIVFSDLAPYSAVEFRAYLQEDTGTVDATLSFEYSTDNGSSYSNVTGSFLTAPNGQTDFAEGWFDWTTGELKYWRGNNIVSSTLGAAPVSVTNLRFAASSGDDAQVIIKAFGGIT